ncbi:MAG: hypothetical protein HQ582_01345, partial [Planctomycetes bacterium]|nr:hypothetical protein [Planctomycetota bacterium]
LVLSHAAPGFSKPGVIDRVIADVSRTYSGALCFPEELTTVDLANRP